MLQLDAVYKNENLLPFLDLAREGETALIEGLWDAPKALLVSLAQQATGKHVLLLTGAGEEESRLYYDFKTLSDRSVIEFPAWETLPDEKVAPSPDVVGERYAVLQKLRECGEKFIVLSNLHACLQKLIAPDDFEVLFFSVNKGDSLPFDTLVGRLVAMGYTRRPVASDKGEFAVRGGIVDVFPVGLPDAYRIEYWGDTIESIRIYDPVGQKSVKAADSLSLTPAKELELLDSASSLVTLLDYLGPETVVVFDDLLQLEDRYATLLGGMKESPTFFGIDDFLDALKPLQKIYFSSLPAEELSEVHITERRGNIYSHASPVHGLSFQMFNRTLTAKRWMHPFMRIQESLLPFATQEFSDDDILNALPLLKEQRGVLALLTMNDTEEENLKTRLMDTPLPDDTTFIQAYLSSGFCMRGGAESPQAVVLPTTEFTHRYRMRRQKLRSTYHTPPTEVYELKAGETVVHMGNGIGRFLGMEKRPNNVGVETEFFLIEYAEGAKLYVPIDQANMVSKYIGAGDETPTLHALGSKRWKSARERTERAIMGYASELLEAYAKRSVKGGFSFGEDSSDLRSFEDEFPFVETEDQMSAIKAMKEDMKSERAMDRLVCGDVGYGKTEVAMRAAFKAVVDGGKQVAVLVPTTVLAMQHYDTFRERMMNFPVRVEVLSRVHSAKETHEALKGLADGSIDIVIGTHRLISGDVFFKDLGLIIIDEEQRFGVKAKEHLKKAKTGVDCLTLSATPIPRTLYMAMMGARDMSIINTPPQDRLPITTVIAEPNDQTIKNALLRELARDGQAFFIHNRVESIFEVASKIQKLLPQARIVVGHGQMDPEEIDLVFHKFKQGEADILVATTIVENGVDIPNANTIIIDRADHFGLADLYQLRGRVGRWNRRAYAYLLVPHNRSSDMIVRQRIGALAEVSGGYGGGMKVAMRDLEIRGAGDILGIEQSGHITAVGFHLYCKLLKRRINALQGKIPTGLVDTKVEMVCDARLPETYVNESSLRMEVYHRLGEAVSWEEIDEIWSEMKDRFGPPPMPAKWLYALSRVRTYASRMGLSLVKFDGKALTVQLKKGDKSDSFSVPLPPPKTPSDLEGSVIGALKKMFSVK